MALSARLGPGEQASLRLRAGQLAMRDQVRDRMLNGEYRLQDVPCPCGDARETCVIAERDRYGLAVRTVLCETCGLLRTSPRLDAASTQRFYETEYRDLYTGVDGAHDLYEGQLARGRSLASGLSSLMPHVSRVYEVGCGAGGILSAFQEAGKTVMGADYGDEYLQEGRSRGLTLVRGNATALLEEAGGEQADLVLLMHVLEHFLDLDAELGKVLSLVRPGGFLAVEVPGIETIATSYRGDILLYLQNAHTYHFSAATLTMVLRAQGVQLLMVNDRAFAVAHVPPGRLSYMGYQSRSGEANRILQRLSELEAAYLQGLAA